MQLLAVLAGADRRSVGDHVWARAAHHRKAAARCDWWHSWQALMGALQVITFGCRLLCRIAVAKVCARCNRWPFTQALAAAISLNVCSETGAPHLLQQAESLPPLPGIHARAYGQVVDDHICSNCCAAAPATGSRPTPAAGPSRRR